MSSSDVVVEVARLSEPSLAQLTRKRPFVRVDAEMLRQVTELNERLAADGTLERPVLEVKPHVLTQLTRVQKLLATLRTRVGRTARVILRLHV